MRQRIYKALSRFDTCLRIVAAYSYAVFVLVVFDRGSKASRRRGHKVLALLAVIYLGVFSEGCAAHKKAKCHNCQFSVPAQASFDPSRCKDAPKGKYICKEVTFDPQAVQAK